MPPDYTFVPWLRRGVAAEIADVDTLGENLDAGPPGHAAVPVELTLETTPVPGATAVPPAAITRSVSILGPGDVAAIKAEAILRTQPANGTLGATPGELAYVEFYDEDFPWRYTPARADGSQLRPWIALLVLTEFEFTLRERQSALPVLTLTELAVLPPHVETWAWAHAQLSGTVAAGDVDDWVRSRPDHALSRLLAPRRLLPDTAYHAFLVPAFEAGRLVGLGRDASQTPAQRPAWGTPAHEEDRDYPVYHGFSFTTGTSGDFETLARKLTPQEVGDTFGKRPLDVADPGFGMPARAEAAVDLEGALAPPDFEERRTEFPESPGEDVSGDLEDILVAGEERLVTDPASDDDLLIVPPLYGRWHADLARVADASGDFAWLAELNLDLRSRAAAGLGAEVVRERQEELVQRAWEQVGQVEEANQRLREAELARGAGDVMLRKHVAQAGDGDRILVLTSLAQTGLSVPEAGDTTSIRGAVDASRVPAAAQAPAFRRITRPQRPLMRRLTGAADLTNFQGGLLSDMNAEAEAALSAAPPAEPPAAGVDLETVRTAVGQAVQELADKDERSDRVFLDILQIELRALLSATPPADLDLLPESDLTDAVLVRVDSRYPPGTSTPEQNALADRVRTLANAITGLESDGPAAGIVTVNQAEFQAEYGDKISGKSLSGVKVLGSAPPAGTEVAPAAELSDAQAFASNLGTFASGIASRPDPDPADPLEAPSTLAGHLLGELEPARTIGDRLISALPALAGRAASDPKRLAPIMAHPQFRDAMFEPLRGLSQDHIVPNVSDLPRDSLTLMEPNRRFIESYMAGLNHSFAQELLWREYPTDMRGTYFKAFWDTRDALSNPDRDDIKAMDGWEGDLGGQSELPAGVLVLVVRGELLEKYPSTVVYAQPAMWPGTDTSQPRVLDPAGEARHPILHAKLEPDITLVGFDLSEEDARGQAPDDAGFFFVLMERPGEPRFGLDDATPAQGLQTWNDLAWDAIVFPEETPNIELAANAALAPAVNQPAVWSRTAADMAAILFQAPVLLARHASEMLP